MNGAFAMDSGGVDARVLVDHLDSRTLTETGERQPGPFRGIGQSPEWRQVLRQAAQVAVTDTTVFLQGVSGTGKEVVARFIQPRVAAGRGPFVAINCAALPEQLLESEPFWLRPWCVHGGPAGEGRPNRAGDSGGPVPRRSERNEPDGPGEAGSCPSGAGVPPTRRHAARQGQCPRHRREQPGFAEGSRRRQVSGGFVLSVAGLRYPHASLARRRGDIPFLIDAFLLELNRSTGCSSAGPNARRARDVGGLRVAWQRAEASQRARAGGHLMSGGLISGEHLSLRSMADSWTGPGGRASTKP
jgi:hypothetical protein